MIVAMRVGCAECGCVVDDGIRVVLCPNVECCCRDLPSNETPGRGLANQPEP